MNGLFIGIYTRCQSHLR